jgi:hypothetical protein
MIRVGELAYADAFFGVPGGVYALDARRLGRAYANGDAVRYAPDLLGRSVAVQDTLANRPTFTLETATRPGLKFTSSANSFFEAHDQLKAFADSPFAFFSVVRRVNDNDRVLYSWGGVTSGNVTEYAIYLRFRTTGRLLQYGNGTSSTTSNNVAPATATYILSQFFDGTNIILRANGVQVSSGSIGPRANVTDSPFFIGRQGLNLISMLDGDFYDFLAYVPSQPMPISDVQRIERRLAQRWGVTL